MPRHVMSLILTAAILAVGLLGLAGRDRVGAGGPKRAVYRLDHVKIERAYNFFGADKSIRRDFKPGAEIIKGNPGRIELGASRSWYSYRVALSVNAPEVVEDGQTVTVSGTAEHTWTLKLNKPSMDLGLGGNVGVIFLSDQKNLKATATRPITSGRYTLRAEKSRTVVVNKDDLFGRGWEKDGVKYIRFPAAASAGIGGDGANLDVNFVYRQDSTAKAKPDPVATKPEPVIPRPKSRPDPEPKVIVTVTGAMVTGETMSVAATLFHAAKVPAPTLELPGEFEHLSPRELKEGPMGARIATWRIRPLKAGSYVLRIAVEGATVPSQDFTITDRPTAPSVRPEGGRLEALDVSGPLSEGMVFTVTASVSDPLPGQSLSLSLSPGLERMEDPESQPVPPMPPVPTAKSGRSEVTWKVKALEAGVFRASVKSSTGPVLSEPILIAERPRSRSPNDDPSTPMPTQPMPTQPEPSNPMPTEPMPVEPTLPEPTAFSVLDAQKALKMWVELIPEGLELDVDQSRRVDSRDAVLILQRVGAQLSQRP